MKSHNKGITLIELMVVVMIIAILAAIAYPSYRSYSVRANRTEGKTALLQLAQALEKCYTRIHNYQECSDGDAPNDVEVEITTDSTLYATSFNGAVTATRYSLQAVPQGAQAADARCGTLRLDETGRRTQTGTGTLKECW